VQRPLEQPELRKQARGSLVQRQLILRITRVRLGGCLDSALPSAEGDAEAVAQQKGTDLGNDARLTAAWTRRRRELLEQRAMPRLALKGRCWPSGTKMATMPGGNTMLGKER